MQKAAYGVPGLDQEGGEILQKRLERLPGVRQVTVWPSEQQIVVTYDPAAVSPGTLVDAIRRLGYMAQYVQWVHRTPG